MSKKVYQIKKNELGKRLDLIISSNEKQYSRNYIINLIKKGNVKLNKITECNPSKKIKISGILEIHFPNVKEESPIFLKRLDVVYEDKELVVINKPPGVLTHPTKGNKTANLVDILLEKGFKLFQKNVRQRAGVVHRLDKDTSGLIVFAKTKEALNFLSKQFFLRNIIKIYEAIIWGTPQPLSGTINIPILKYKKKKKASFNETAKSAITEYRTLKTDEKSFSLVECRTLTGRTHQIRVHMLSINCPLIGDQLYSRGRNLSDNILEKKATFIKNFNRQALHAKELRFIHPTKNKHLIFKSKKPKDMLKLERILFDDD